MFVMAQFVPNTAASNSVSQQWQQHLQIQEYVTDVTRSIERSIDAYNERAATTDNVIRESSDHIADAVDHMAQDVSETIVSAAIAEINTARRNAAAIVGAIERSTDSLSEAVYTVGQTLDHRLTVLIDQNRIGHLLLRNVSELLRIPDFQKERLHYIQQGFKHYQNASIDPSLMQDALSNLKKAEERELSDYVVLHRIGMIYLYSQDHIDAPAAEEYFLRAARYAAVEAEPAAARVAFVLSGNSNDALSEHTTDLVRVKRLAADASLQAGFACYLQRRLPDAIKHSRRAIELYPEYALAQFNCAKFWAAAGQMEQAIHILEPLIRADPIYSVSAADDADLAIKPETRMLLTRLRDEVAERLHGELAEIQALKPPFLAQGGDRAQDFSAIVNHWRSGRYLNLVRGLKELLGIRQAVRSWQETVEGLSILRRKIGSKAPVAAALVASEAKVLAAKRFEVIQQVRAGLCNPNDK
jgi:tetratricopeptide (TPR) repeat protein